MVLDLGLGLILVLTGRRFAAAVFDVGLLVIVVVLVLAVVLDGAVVIVVVVSVVGVIVIDFLATVGATATFGSGTSVFVVVALPIA